MYIKRILSLKNLKKSVFLFGCRQTGKTYLLKHTLKPDIYIDLLKRNELIRYIKNPDLLFAEIESLKGRLLIVIDEIQKIPNLLDEIHRIIESEIDATFILTGSSSRKLKRSQANLLAGRAIVFNLYPFCFTEIKELFSLNNYLLFGGIPTIFLEENIQLKRNILSAYVNIYLKEEIYDEALTRNLPAFTRFLEMAAFENGNIINYSTIAREIGVSSNLIKEYFYILEDTLIGFFLQPFYKSHRKRVINHPKFYFIDTGIVFALKKMLSIELLKGTDIFGKAFEHFIILETLKSISYLKQEINMYFFRTYDGSEVDLILEKHNKIVAIEIKSSENPKKLKGLKSFLNDHSVEKAYCVCITPRTYTMNNILFLPWKEYINRLNNEEIF